MPLAPLPIGIQHDPGTLFAQGEFVIEPHARHKHMAIFGTTGAPARARLLRNMIATNEDGKRQGGSFTIYTSCL